MQIFEQKYEGKTFHVVKDPVCLRYYRFNKQEYFVFGLFDGKHTMEQVREAFEDEFKPHRLEYQDLESFARQLVTAGLGAARAAGRGPAPLRSPGQAAAPASGSPRSPTSCTSRSRSSTRTGS